MENITDDDCRCGSFMTDGMMSFMTECDKQIQQEKASASILAFYK